MGRWVVLALRRDLGGLVGTTRISLLAFDAREGAGIEIGCMDERRDCRREREQDAARADA